MITPQKCGTHALGSGIPLAGRARNVSATQSGIDGADIATLYEGDGADRRMAVYVDGALSDVLPAAAGISGATALAQGEHSLTVVPLGVGAAAPDVHYDVFGQHAVLNWTPGTATDIAAYNVYWDAGANVTPATLYATVARIKVQRRDSVAPDSGTGAGRISCGGAYIGTGPVNALCTVTVTAAGVYGFTYRAFTGAGVIQQGDTIILPDGLFLRFEDAPSAYDVSDAWTIRIGPPAQFISSALAAGTYRFRRAIVDKAGNERMMSDEAVCIVPLVPAACTGVALAWDADADTLTVSWMDPAALESVNVHTNFAPATNSFRPYVDEECSFASINAGVQSWVFASPPNGTLLFYLRPVKNGLERDDQSLYSFSFPPTPADLGLVLSVPLALSATAIAGGCVRLDWYYRGTDADALDHFAVWVSTAGGSVDFTASPTTTVAPGFVGLGPAAFSYTTGALTDGGVYQFGVRAVAATGDVTRNTDTASATADATAPSYSGTLTAGPA